MEDEGGVEGDACETGGMTMLFFFRATGGRGGLAIREFIDDDDGMSA